MQGISIVGEDGFHPCCHHCCHGYCSCGGRWLASTLVSALLSSLPLQPSLSWKQMAHITIIIATMAIIITDVLLIVVGVEHGSSLCWWSTWVVVV